MELKPIKARAVGTVIYTYEYMGFVFYLWKSKPGDGPAIPGCTHKAEMIIIDIPNVPVHMPKYKNRFTNKSNAIIYATEYIARVAAYFATMGE